MVAANLEKRQPIEDLSIRQQRRERYDCEE
jgi:hypothetical protein